MKSTEFHKLNAEYFKKLEELGYKKIKGLSAWAREGKNNVGIEFRIRLDKWGWFPQHGSEFVYEVVPRYKGKTVQYYLADNIRLYELKKFDPKIIRTAEIVLNNFAEKLPRYDGAEDDILYVFRKSPWTHEKILNNIGDWFHYYDAEDVLAWHNANYQALIQAMDEKLSRFETEDFSKPRRGLDSSEVMRAEMHVDTSNGKHKLELKDD
jgi:hypothetical protein